MLFPVARPSFRENAGEVSERITFIEQTIGDCVDRHSQELAAIRQAHERQAKELAGTKDLHTKAAAEAQRAQAAHLNVAQRLDVLEVRLRQAFDG